MYNKMIQVIQCFHEESHADFPESPRVSVQRAILQHDYQGLEDSRLPVRPFVPVRRIGTVIVARKMEAKFCKWFAILGEKLFGFAE